MWLRMVSTNISSASLASMASRPALSYPLLLTAALMRLASELLLGGESGAWTMRGNALSKFAPYLLEGAA